VPLNDAVNSVVSIFAGESLGSGVLISSDGYILTNHHVAGASGRVRIRWADGAESVGEVIRGDARRDVALIKASPRAVALSIRHTPAQLGETVFAVGTPLDKELAGTVTRGVVSSNRQLDGQSWIQSDVAVTHGNSGGPLLDESGALLGLTDWGVAPNGVSANLNFFIPIEDALRALALKPGA
jgi:serine protease Do